MRNQSVNILHISDLHYDSRRAHDHDVVLQAFLEDLKDVSSSELKPDLIIFSGDLVHSGDCYSDYCDVLDTLIHPILSIAEVDESRVFLVPGNHDAQRSAIAGNEVVQTGLERTLTDRSSFDQHYLDAAGHEYVRMKFNNFIQLKDCLNNSSIIRTDPYIDTCYVRDVNVAIVTKNTAWMSCAGLAGRGDRGHLLVSEACVRRALESLPTTEATILVGHHPLDWLAGYAWDDLRRLLERQGLIYLHGHMHEPVSQSVRSTMGRSLAHQSGALFVHRDRYNGYAIIRVDPEYGHAEVNLRSYYQRRGQFDVATDVVGGGRWYSSPEAEAFWSALQPPFAASNVSKWLADRVRPALQASLDDGFSDRPVSEVFVPPSAQTHSKDSGSRGFVRRFGSR